MAFDTPEEIRLHAAQIEQQAVLSKIMPLGNTTGMTEAERQMLGAWIEAGAPLQVDADRATLTASPRRARCSSRSLPQNSSPSSVTKLGAPNMPSLLRRLGFASGAGALFSAALGTGERRRASSPSAVEDARSAPRGRRCRGRRRTPPIGGRAEAMPQPSSCPINAMRAAVTVFCGKDSGRRNGKSAPRKCAPDRATCSGP